MLKGLNLDIKGFGLINDAHIEIGKINVIGGVNSSGKSTASRILYCFLKAMSLSRKEYLFSSILPTINEFVSIMFNPNPNGISDLEVNFTLDDDIYEILTRYDTARKIYAALDPTFFAPPNEIFNEMQRTIDTAFSILLEDDNAEYSPIVKSLFSNENLLSFEGNSSFYNDSFRCDVSYEHVELDDMSGDIILPVRENILKSKDICFDDLDSNFIYSTEGSFNFLNDVCYIDSISIFDLDYYLQSNRTTYKEHVEYLLKQLKNDEGYITINVKEGNIKKDKVDVESKLSKEMITKMDSVNKRISDIIGGSISRKAEFYFNDKPIGNEMYYFNSSHSDESFKMNISSGIQQISIIQILLSNYRLQPESFLIIDEPEVNLHPEWQFKFAEILVLLAKELEITIYLNSHSPMFIEAIEVLTMYYDLENETNFYLTKKQENGKYNFVKVDYDNLFELYDNLARPYDAIEVYRLKAEYRKGNY